MLHSSASSSGWALQHGTIDALRGRDSQRASEFSRRMAPEVATELHFDGCQACVFAGSQVGCPRGDRCAYCHTGHPLISRRKGLRKSQRERISSRILRVFRGQNLVEVHDAQLRFS